MRPGNRASAIRCSSCIRGSNQTVVSASVTTRTPQTVSLTASNTSPPLKSNPGVVTIGCGSGAPAAKSNSFNAAMLPRPTLR